MTQFVVKLSKRISFRMWIQETELLWTWILFLAQRTVYLSKKQNFKSWKIEEHTKNVFIFLSHEIIGPFFCQRLQLCNYQEPFAYTAKSSRLKTCGNKMKTGKISWFSFDKKTLIFFFLFKKRWVRNFKDKIPQNNERRQTGLLVV